MPLSEFEKLTENPNRLEYDGAFLVELRPNTPISHVPHSATVSNDIVQVADGRVVQHMGNIQMYGLPNKKDPFYFGYTYIICIRDGEGTLLWRNYDVI